MKSAIRLRPAACDGGRDLRATLPQNRIRYPRECQQLGGRGSARRHVAAKLLHATGQKVAGRAHARRAAVAAAAAAAAALLPCARPPVTADGGGVRVQAAALMRAGAQAWNNATGAGGAAAWRPTRHGGRRNASSAAPAATYVPAAGAPGPRTRRRAVRVAAGAAVWRHCYLDSAAAAATAAGGAVAGDSLVPRAARACTHGAPLNDRSGPG
ncbi:hypothetical protein JKP88DRAFT_273934 [Tribonema minus]|uniref:Uncharacterized protein n=1 Tax=Tribonema minus TaxID=303371 RepID=A0A835YRD6_9STRA|nr:hypothetical protein JKP88DRAFT_273934 [Tribonema minus]